MNKLTDRPPMSRTDKLCLVALAGCFLAPHLAVWAMDAAAYRAAEADKPPVEVVTVARPIDCTPLAEAIAARKAELFWQTVPLDAECRAALEEACEEHGVPICLVLGVIHEESRFDPEAGNDISYGLMGLNKKYYPSDLAPTENIRAGVSHLAGQIERYDGDVQAALRAYNKGWDDGDRAYARAVLDASEKWGKG
ncbi:hypothetical protein D1641_18640 [Colidextribacter sp. OB.20]|uniref:transglycosylase SLT domain-containing protein n=1 Tax=Colidextribacter sp. OB.20 TaxID=2304568 RepID=UPI00136EFD3C|nr:transglycosylase SLT domain-containing protein [Colidextribacter sp. OB.20]NBI11973.1 hypothetical protein [Colidextribacter sp. OB.20]